MREREKRKRVKIIGMIQNNRYPLIATEQPTLNGSLFNRFINEWFSKYCFKRERVRKREEYESEKERRVWEKEK